MRGRLVALVAVLPALSSCGSISPGQAGPAAVPSPSPTSQLGTSLSPVSLHASPGEVLQVLGEPTVRTVAHGLGTPEWQYASGLTVNLSDTVWQLVAQPPYSGATAEGFHLGDSETTVRSIYRQFSLWVASDPLQLWVTDERGIRLSAAFDASGKATSLVLHDTRAFEASTTPPVRSGLKPPARFDASALYDVPRNRVLMFGGLGQSCCLGDTWAFDEQVGWREVKPATAPSARRAASIAFDWARQTVVLFGGDDHGLMNDTWVWDEPTWKQLSPPNSPPARTGASMAYDPKTQSLVLFGGVGVCCDLTGRRFSGRTQLGDTWLWNGKTWSPVSHASMAFDRLANTVVLFGGFNGDGGELSDTWTWNGTTWRQLLPGSSPTARSGASMVSFPKGMAQGNLLLFGGMGRDGVALADTWTWNGTTWTLQPASGPPARSLAALAIVAEKRIFLTSGSPGGGKAPLDDRWSWNGVEWTRLQ